MDACIAAKSLHLSSRCQFKKGFLQVDEALRFRLVAVADCETLLLFAATSTKRSKTSQV